MNEKIKTKFLLIITGGVAAYKSLELLRLLMRADTDVKVIMTKSAHEFITPLSVAALTGNPPYSDLFDVEDETRMGHIQLARWADNIIVAPASANIIAKMAHGICDDLASTCLLAQNVDNIIIAPAMNPVMWANKNTQENVNILKQQKKLHIIGPDSGEMACLEHGVGRLSAPQDIVDYVMNLPQDNKRLDGKKIIVTGGATIEAIDPVRYISNYSSGKQALHIAKALYARGADVVFIHGNISVALPSYLTAINVHCAQEMYDYVLAQQAYDVMIGAAAVCDWRVANIAEQKIKKQFQYSPSLEFTENPDIISAVGHLREKNRPALVIGFAAESEHIIEYAREKLNNKKCDMIIANDIRNGDIFGSDYNNIHIIKSSVIDAHQQRNYNNISKVEVAHILCDEIYDYFYNKNMN